MATNFHIFTQGDELTADQMNALQSKGLVTVDTFSSLLDPQQVPAGVKMCYVSQDENIWVRDATQTNYPSGWKKIKTSLDDRGTVNYLADGRPDIHEPSPGVVLPNLPGPVGSTFTALTPSPAIGDHPNTNYGAMKWIRVKEDDSDPLAWKCVDGHWGQHILVATGWYVLAISRDANRMTCIAWSWRVSSFGLSGSPNLVIPDNFSPADFTNFSLTFQDMFDPARPFITPAATMGAGASNAGTSHGYFVHEDSRFSVAQESFMTGSFSTEVYDHRWPIHLPATTVDATASVQEAIDVVEAGGDAADEYLLHPDSEGRLVHRDSAETFLSVARSQIDVLNVLKQNGAVVFGG